MNVIWTIGCVGLVLMTCNCLWMLSRSRVDLSLIQDAEVRERVEKAAPWMKFHQSPYVLGTQLVWVVLFVVSTASGELGLVEPEFALNLVAVLFLLLNGIALITGWARAKAARKN